MVTEKCRGKGAKAVNQTCNEGSDKRIDISSANEESACGGEDGRNKGKPLNPGDFVQMAPKEPACKSGVNYYSQNEQNNWRMPFVHKTGPKLNLFYYTFSAPGAEGPEFLNVLP